MNKLERFYWAAYCSKHRSQAITEIRNIISSRGFIVDFNRFSDVSVSFGIEIEKQKIGRLYKELKEYMGLDDFKEFQTDSREECAVLLNVTFTKSTGDMKIEVPSVPG